MGIVNEGFVEIVAASAVMSAELRDALPQSNALPAPGDAVPRWLERWLATLRSFNAMARHVQGLRAASIHVQGNLAALAQAPQRIGEREANLVGQWPDLVDAYMRGNDIDHAVDALMNFVIHPAWPSPVGLMESARMREQLRAFRVQAGNVPVVLATGLIDLEGPPAQVSARATETYDTLRLNLDPVRSDLSEQRRVPRGDAPQNTGLVAQHVAAEPAEPPPPQSLRDALAHLAAAAESLVSEDAAHPGGDAVQGYVATVQSAIDSAAQARAPVWLDVLRRLQENLWPLSETFDAGGTVTIDPAFALALLDLSQLALALSEQPQDAQVCDALLSGLASNAWSWPLPAHERPVLRAAFGFAAHSRLDPIADADAPDSAFAPMSEQAPQRAAEELRSPAPEVMAAPPGPACLHDAFAHMAQAAEGLAGDDVTPPSREAVPHYLSAVEAALEAAAAGDEALAWLDVLCRLQENLCAISTLAPADARFRLDPALATALIDTPQLAMALLAQPSDSQLCDALLDGLSADCWPTPLPRDEVPALRTAFGFAPHIRFDPIPDDDAPESAFAPMEEGSATEPSPGNGAPTQRCDAEHLAVLAQEFGAFALGLQAEMDDARSERPAQARREAIERYGEMIQRIGETCATVGLTALEQVFAQIALRTGLVIDSGLTEAHCLWLRTVVQHVRAYLAAPNDPSAAGAMVEVLSDGSWPPTLPAAEAARLETALAGVEIFTDASLRPQRVREASAEDVSLALPRDINPELLDGLLSELPLQSADFAGAMERVVSGRGSLYDLDVAKRAAHTLKGAANTVGVRGIASLTHHLEDVLISLTRFGLMPTRELTQVLVSAADCLEAMSEAVQGVADAPRDAQQVLQQVLDWANRFDEDGADALGQAPASPQAATVAPAAPHALPSDGTGAAESAPAADDVQASAQGAPQAMLRVPAALVDELLRLVGETMIANTQIKEQLRQTSQHVQAVTRQNLNLQQLTGELETLVDIRGMTGQGVAVAKSGEAMDALEFERFNELHTATRRLIEAATDARELSAGGEARLKALAELLDAQSRLHADNQKAVVSTRMVPVASVVSRLQRSVRQTCRLLDKPVTLNVRGDQTLLDVNILNDLLDPLMHMLRNAVDHGIESPPTRTAAGKPAAGQIDLSFVREGSSMVVRCSDDGAGLDLARIRAKALERGLLAEGQTVSDEELARHILLPGFSTRDASSEVSGRGIGMDAVYSRVLMLKGSLRLNNRPGQGLLVELRVPTSLMTTHGLLVRMNDQVIALTSFGISGIQHVMSEQVRKMGAEEVYMEGGQAHHVLNLAQLLGYTERRHAERGWFPALMVQTDTGLRRAIQVQDVLDSQELVVKDLGKYVPHPPGVIGVTILGDGNIAPVLDLPQLLREMTGGTGAGARRGRSASAHSSSRIEARMSALVVDDSLSARRAAAQVLRDAGFDVRTAIDGMEAAAILDKMVPQVVIVDMEMPRMNGLELTTHIRTREATRHVPVIMITSRSTEKHRQMAESAGVDMYLTKPFNDDDLQRHVHRLTAVAKAA